METMRFIGKTVIITGAASGIGECAARKFAAEGANVVVCCRKGKARGGQLVKEITEEGYQAVLIEADVSKFDEVKAMVDAAIDKFGKIDIFVSNAGKFDGYNDLIHTTDEIFDMVFDTNVRGNFNCAKAVIPHMMNNGGGVLLIISSVAGVIAGHGGPAYTASKHAVNGFAKQITHDYGKFGIRCNSICPGTILTEMTEPILKDNVKALEKIKRTPFGKYGEPKHIADVMLFLASDEAEFIHGVNYLVDGGNLVRKWE
ncbi:MAG: glucose 1-dehydrogenase [Pseudomonadota bacterium]